MHTRLQNYLEARALEANEDEANADASKTSDSGTDRQATLLRLADAIAERLARPQRRSAVQLLFVCTHNSRRSQMSQAAAAAAATYYGVAPLTSFSGGTEVTAPHPQAMQALERAGFVVKPADAPAGGYLVAPTAGGDKIVLFSKLVNDPANPAAEFIAVMTCSEADAGCPIVPGADARISLPYQDPKAYDNSPEVAAAYDRCLAEISRDAMFVFNHVAAAAGTKKPPASE